MYDNNIEKSYKLMPYMAKNLINNAASQAPSKNPTTGHVAVGVFTALGALPVKDASVVIYDINKDGTENDIYIGKTDVSGRVPDIELPVTYDPNNPLTSPDFYFSTYNIKVTALNYYTENILNFRVFPGVKTNLKINLIPSIK